MFCKNCGKEINENQAICLNCGVKKGVGNKFCANCGKSVDENASVCLSCGVAIKNNHAADFSSLKANINTENIKANFTKENILKKPNLFISILSIIFLFLPFYVVSTNAFGFNGGDSANAFQIIFGMDGVKSDFICIILLIVPILIILSYLTSLFKNANKYIQLISPIVGLVLLMIFRVAYFASYGNAYVSTEISGGFGFWLSVISYIAMTIFAILDFRKAKKLI